MPESTEEADPAISRACRDLEGEIETLTRQLGTGENDGETRAAFESAAGALQTLLAAANGGHGRIDTQSGRSITPLEPEPAAIDLGDAAHALSNLSRFAGQGAAFYSVARHAISVSHEVEARGGSLAAQRWGLLHDVSEAYLADVPAPVKRSLPGYTHAEKRLQAAVRRAFGIELTDEDERLVDAADGALGRYELAAHFPDAEHEQPSLESDPGAVDSAEFEPGGDAKELFLERARELALE